MATFNFFLAFEKLIEAYVSSCPHEKKNDI